MARPSKGLRYIEPHIGPDNKLRYYFRCKGKRTLMPPVDGDPKLDPAWMAAYAILFAEATGHALDDNAPKLTRAARQTAIRTSSNSFAAALDRYFRHSTWASLAPDTQETHRTTLKRFARKYGDISLLGLTHKAIQAAIKPLEPWPQQHLVIALKRFVGWAQSTGEMDDKVQDPTLGLKLHKMPKVKGHQPWTDKERAQFERRWPVGTQQRLAYEIMLRIGLRRADVRRLGPQHIVDGWLRFQPRKTSRTTAVWLDQPMDTTLAKVIAATKVIGTKTFLVNEQGEPFAKSSFAAFMRRAYADAGLPTHCRNHGLRKCMMLDLVAIEVKAHDIMAMSGHTTLKEIENYTRHFDRRAAAVRAMEKRDRKERQ